MNVSYKMTFLLKWGIPLILFASYFFLTHSKLTLIIALFATIRVIFYGLKVHRKGEWDKINLQHDQRTQNNALLAGNIMYFLTLFVLFIGVNLIQNSMLSITYSQLIGYTILTSLILRWIIRDYLNHQVEIDN